MFLNSKKILNMAFAIVLSGGFHLGRSRMLAQVQMQAFLVMLLALTLNISKG